MGPEAQPCGALGGLRPRNSLLTGAVTTTAAMPGATATAPVSAGSAVVDPAAGMTLLFGGGSASACRLGAPFRLLLLRAKYRLLAALSPPLSLHLFAPQASQLGTDLSVLEPSRAPAALSRASHSTPHFAVARRF